MPPADLSTLPTNPAGEGRGGGLKQGLMGFAPCPSLLSVLVDRIILYHAFTILILLGACLGIGCK